MVGKQAPLPDTAVPPPRAGGTRSTMSPVTVETRSGGGRAAPTALTKKETVYPRPRNPLNPGTCPEGPSEPDQINQAGTARGRTIADADTRLACTRGIFWVGTGNSAPAGARTPVDRLQLASLASRVLQHRRSCGAFRDELHRWRIW